MSNRVKKQPARPCRHHYIPRFILRLFADGEERIWWTRTGGKEKGPIHPTISNVFLKKNLYTVYDENGVSDRNERILAEKEGVWADALQRIRQLVSEEREDQIEGRDALLALEYYLYAGIRTPEHLNWVMYTGDHKPRDVIDKELQLHGIEGNLGKDDYPVLERNIRAYLGSGQADLVQSNINELTRTLGLGIYKLEPDTGNFIIGSYGAAKISLIDQEMYFIPVAPTMALFSTNRPGCLVITRQGKEGVETLHKMNNATWNASQWVAATSLELLNAVEDRAR